MWLSLLSLCLLRCRRSKRGLQPTLVVFIRAHNLFKSEMDLMLNEVFKEYYQSSNAGPILIKVISTYRPESLNFDFLNGRAEEPFFLQLRRLRSVDTKKATSRRTTIVACLGARSRMRARAASAVRSSHSLVITSAWKKLGSAWKRLAWAWKMFATEAWKIFATHDNKARVAVRRFRRREQVN